MRKLLIATHNQGKFKDFKEALKTYNFDIVSLRDLNITQEVEEDGETFEDNSLKKARFYAHLSGMLTLADDGGLEIAALNNLPGVHTRRWHGEERLTDEQLVEKILLELNGKHGQERRARLRAVITIFNPETNDIISTEAKIEGEIVEELTTKIDPGLPVRSIFYVPDTGKVYAEFDKVDKEKFNHRKLAIQNLRTELIQLK